MTQTLASVLASITDAPVVHAVRDCRDLQIGQCVHQGDIYLHRVPDSHPRGALLGTRKLAVGQGEGSNHMAEGDGVSVYAGVAAPKGFSAPDGIDVQDLLGPVVVADADWLNTHTTHAHHQLGCGTFQVTYQADLLTMRRVVD